jgi:sensor histidine kinase YesM
MCLNKLKINSQIRDFKFKLDSVNYIFHNYYAFFCVFSNKMLVFLLLFRWKGLARKVVNTDKESYMNDLNMHINRIFANYKN